MMRKHLKTLLVIASMLALVGCGNKFGGNTDPSGDLNNNPGDATVTTGPETPGNPEITIAPGGQEIYPTGTNDPVTGSPEGPTDPSVTTTPGQDEGDPNAPVNPVDPTDPNAPVSNDPTTSPEDPNGQGQGSGQGGQGTVVDPNPGSGEGGSQGSGQNDTQEGNAGQPSQTPVDPVVPTKEPAATATVAPTATKAPAATATVAPTATKAPTATATAAPTATKAPTATSTPKPTATNTPRPTATNTPRPTATNTPRPTATNTPRPTATNTPRPTATSTPRPTATSTPRPTATNTPRPTATNTPRPTATSTPRPTATNTPRPTATSTPKPTATTAPAAGIQTATVNGKTLSIGMTASQLVSAWGNPARKETADTNCTSYVYNSNYNTFAIVLVSSSNVVEGYYVMSKNLSVDGVTASTSKTTVQDKYNGNGYVSSYDSNMGVVSVRKSDAYINFFIDVNNDNTVYAIQYISDNVRSVVPTTSTTKLATEKQIFDITNAYRSLYGKTAYLWSDTANQIARNYSERMGKENFFDHYDPQGRGVKDRVGGSSWRSLGENISGNSITYGWWRGHIIGSVANTASWITSSGHRKKVLGAYESLGVGIATGFTSSDWNDYGTQVFFSGSITLP